MRSVLTATWSVFVPLAIQAAGLTPDHAQVDRGKVISGPVLVQAFQLNNPLQDSVQIQSVEMTCGCGRFDLSAKQVPAGGRVTLTVAINTLTQAAGPGLWKTVVSYRIGTSTTEQRMELIIRATIVPEIRVEPPVVAISTTGEIQQPLTVIDRRTQPLRVVRVSTVIRGLSADLGDRERTDNGSQQLVRLKGGRDLPVGIHEDQVILHTDDTTCPELRVPVRIQKRSDAEWSVQPESPIVRLAKDQTAASTLVQVRWSGRAVQIDRVTAVGEGITVRHAEGAGPVATLRVIVDKSRAGSSGTTTLTVYLKQPQETRIVVPVAWIASE